MRDSLETITGTHKRYTYTIEVCHDPDMGPPWKEHDGHGIVSEWERRDKLPGERILHEDGRSKLFYDWSATLPIAKRDGWGLSPEHLAKLRQQLGREPKPGDIAHAAVELDFNHLRGYCQGDWWWAGYFLKVCNPKGEEIGKDSCWGFDDRQYMVSEAESIARGLIADDIKAEKKARAAARREKIESALMACRDIVTV